MDNDSKGARECQPTTSNANANVRIKVSSWVSNFVSEMRTKRPAVVQKWVDSLPTIDNSELSQNDQSAATEDICSRTQSLDSEKSNAKHTSVAIVEKFQELNITVDGNTHSAGEAEVFTNTKSIIDETAVDNSSSATGDNSFWQKSPSILAAFQLRTDASQHSETEDLSASTPVQHSCHESEAASSILNKSKLNEFYNKLNISKKRFNFIKERKMEAKRILNNAKSRFLQSADNGGPDTMSKPDDVSSDNIVGDSNEDDENVAVANAPDAVTTASGTASIVCDAIEMDISTDEYSRLSQSNDFLSVDDDDSFNISMPSINDGQIGPSSHLSVNRKVAMGEIGRSTSDNPRLRNKFYLADIGRSFSEHQDDEAIIIGERNISAPSSSIAIQNNNRSNGNYFERRAYSVSPTQRSLKRGTLSRDQSLSDHSSRHRNQLSKGNSFQSDSSHCSSVESLLDARKPDPEAILRHLGFGPAHQEDLLSRIPKRFLKPSQVPGIDTEAFMRQQQIASNLHEQSILGYRGLVGNPHVIPSVIVAKIMERFQLSEEKNCKLFDVLTERSSSAPPTPGPNDDLSNLP